MVDEKANEMLDSKTDSNNIVEETLSSDYIPQPDCLALTVRKDYNLIIVKNIFTASRSLIMESCSCNCCY